MVSRAKSRLAAQAIVAGTALPKTTGGNNFKLKLAFTNDGTIPAGDIGPFRFVDEVIKTDIYLMDKNNNYMTYDTKAAITCTLLYFNNEDKTVREAPPALLKIEASSDTHFNGRKATIRFSVKDVSYNLAGAKFVLRVSVSSVDNVIGVVEPFLSLAFSTVRHKLIVNTWTQANGTAVAKREEGVRTFFKDEGGHSNCIEVIVELVDCSGRRVLHNKPIPLKVELKYENKSEILPPTLLSVNPDSRLIVDEQGWTKLKFRINEVSTRHQGQKFVLVIAPDTMAQPAHDDIGAVVCTPIEVRSKRNKPRANSNSNNKEERKRKATLAAAATEGDGPRSSKRHMYIYEGGNFGRETIQPREDDFIVSGGEYMHQGRGHQYPQLDRDLNAPPILPQNMCEAVHQVNRWTRNVLTMAQQITWQSIGVNPNTNQELYSMPNPNEKLMSILQQYNQLVRGSLAYLLGHEEVARGGQMVASSSSLFNAQGQGVLSEKQPPFDVQGGLNMSGGSDSLQHQFGAYGVGVPVEGQQHSVGESLSPVGGGGQIRRNPISSISLMDQLEGMDQFPFDVDAGGLSGAEEVVDKILSKALRIGDQVKGLPAFDKLGNVVGFYNQRQEMATSDNPNGRALTKVFFVPLDRAEFDSSVNVVQLTSQLAAYIIADGKNEKMFTLNAMNNDIARLREHAMEIYCMSREHVDF
jgi:hypothetical protein